MYAEEQTSSSLVLQNALMTTNAEQIFSSSLYFRWWQIVATAWITQIKSYAGLLFPTQNIDQDSVGELIMNLIKKQNR